ncbi:Biopolymer transport protein TolA [Candidatus Propionivibrio aalborgensis]|uniref:Biopolymer transport protein TolA n=1 Tax=Candidatus Propionivibrio aalborgensis TaxID=1860101 RepID=A0A1A8Y3R5_9RHOO|nr:hypothetical protein [Candidatus Propionivibrio aalborgensis]MBK7325620.1 hypothetical protein [Propionivibrio sp.]MBK7563071.1 hypothetical protein [Propionivibrio sp.]MBK9029179.1 hypothetical protein [Propionivibrio sp.]SBT11023.1 Biopolymer transport protein TolA [Candidatus Propionivibrio aalborgensis]
MPGQPSRIRRVLDSGLVLFALLSSPLVWAETPAPPEIPIPQTLEQADAQRDRAKQLRDEADRNYESEQKACYKKFLVSGCLDEAKQRHTQSMIHARELDIPARDFQREAKRAEVEAKEAERAADIPSREAEQKEQAEKYRAEEAAKAAKRAQKKADKELKAAENRQKMAAEQAKRQAKLEKRAKKDAERAAKKAQEAAKAEAKAAASAN